MKTALLILGGFVAVCVLIVSLWLRAEAKHCPIDDGHED